MGTRRACSRQRSEHCLSTRRHAGHVERRFMFYHTLNLTVEDRVSAAGVTRVPHWLIRSCGTRRNSDCDMFGRLVEQRWDVSAVQSDRSVTKPTVARTLELRDDFWQPMEDMAPVLEALKCAPTVMPTESEEPTSNTHPVTRCPTNASPGGRRRREVGHVH